MFSNEYLRLRIIYFLKKKKLLIGLDWLGLANKAMSLRNEKLWARPRLYSIVFLERTEYNRFNIFVLVIDLDIATLVWYNTKYARKTETVKGLKPKMSQGLNKEQSSGLSV